MSARKKDKKPSYYTSEFKRLVLHRLLCSEGESVRSLAQEIGIAKSTLWDWKREVGRALDMTDSKPPSRDPEDIRRIAQLEKELNEARVLLELQKKVQAILGEDNEDDDTKSTNDS